ncbi:MAG: hypothetical protein ACU0BF_00535 [Paracoccaceae bacterium]
MTGPMTLRLAYRLAVAALAAVYTVVVLGDLPWGGWAGPLRYLTVWALLASLASAVLMVRHETGRGGRADVFVAVTAVLNVMVIALFWQLYLRDPASVTDGGQLDAWWRELYLHGIGGGLQILDALLLHRLRPRAGRAAAALLAAIAAYVAWAELAVARFNDEPVGAMAAGLPYAFLNDRGVVSRIEVYVTYAAFGLIALALLLGASALIRRATEGRPGRSDSPQTRGSRQAPP